MKRTVALAAIAVGAAGCGSNAGPPPPYQHFVSRTDLRPPPVHVLVPAQGTAPGFVFIAPKKHVAQAGPLILDDRGRVVWFHPLDTRGVTDFRVQRYRGKPVLTWWRGRAAHEKGTETTRSSTRHTVRSRVFARVTVSSATSTSS